MSTFGCDLYHLLEIASTKDPEDRDQVCPRRSEFPPIT